ncbi:hypothetical protein FW778_11785 [Ginsengibacter hankyongi]|uniref:Uncharacterized protein n=1 Tax=Ginsengibacter hankyongi TaxID=2607284 RepID=A0A5J5IJY3_9BACT|nr:hypothetical protein [Ginsengibacter hankyongi]KAA9039492.1 hypothetical protein FW778_11785 [Ginsengibacter hankyongi]
MDDYLHKTLKPGVQINIKDVSYYPDAVKNVYFCEFHGFNNRDTTGIVNARITNDFKKLSRIQ